MENGSYLPKAMIIHGARVHNLKNIDLEIPLGKFVAICGLSGSGKSSLALGVIYSEGSRRYLEALSTYTRRRMTHAAEANIDNIENVPAALALHQRPAVPGVRSTFGTMSELLNVLRLMFSRLGNHRCPNGHLCEPTLNVAADRPLVCDICGASFSGPSAESFSFNSDGGCPSCSGTGIVRTVDRSKLVPDESKTLEEGAVESWNTFGISWMRYAAKELGVRDNVPFRDLTAEEKHIIYDGEEVTKMIIIPSKNGKMFELNCKYRNAQRAVEESLKKAETEKSIEKINKFLSMQICHDCGGNRLSKKANSSLLCGKDLATATAMTLEDLEIWVKEIPSKMPRTLQPMAESITAQFLHIAKRLIDLGLGYLSLDRTGASLSTGERQRVQLARAVRNRTTGVLYVLDEPSIGLHPSNINGLLAVIRDLISHGNSVILVDHDAQLLKEADWIVEMGPGAGEHGGKVLTEGSVKEIIAHPNTQIGGFLSGKEKVIVRKKASMDEMFKFGKIHLSTNQIHTVKPLELDIPKGRLIAVTGVSGSGKTTLVLESLYPAIKNMINKEAMPQHVKSVSAPGISKIHLIDASPIGTNVRSTVATYSNVLDELRKMFSSLREVNGKKVNVSSFSYNTGELRCPECDGTGQITMDVQFLPDVNIVCPACNGSRYSKEASAIKYTYKNKEGTSISVALPELMSYTISQALEKMSGVKNVKEKLQILNDLGLGYLTLGEATPVLSGGEAQRLKLASEMKKAQNDAVFIFDEPTIGLHPFDVRVLINVLERLIQNGATVIVIEHDVDMISNADFVINMGPGGGKSGGEITATGTPESVCDFVKAA